MLADNKGMIRLMAQRFKLCFCKIRNLLNKAHGNDFRDKKNCYFNVNFGGSYPDSLVSTAMLFKKKKMIHKCHEYVHTNKYCLETAGVHWYMKVGHVFTAAGLFSNEVLIIIKDYVTLSSSMYLSQFWSAQFLKFNITHDIIWIPFHILNKIK